MRLARSWRWPGRARDRRATVAAAVMVTVLAGVAVALFTGYLRVSWTVPTTSDGAAQALQARDMLAGNWLLHGWKTSDVSFYTTELPEYVLVELIRPFGTGVIHVAAAVTYTLLVLAAGALARGRARGGEGLILTVIAIAVMLAPQLGYGAFVLLLSPDHVGTELPLLLGWLLLDLAPRRWWVPIVLGLLLAVVQFADRIALLTAVLPLLVVCGVRLARTPALGTGQARKFDAALAAAAAASVPIAWGVARVLTAAGAFTGHPLPIQLAPPGLLLTHVRLTWLGVLELYGASIPGAEGGLGITFAALHLTGLVLGAAGLAVALGRFLRTGGGTNLIDSVLAVAIVVNLLGYVLSTDPGTAFGTGYAAREIAAVLPLGAVLAGRIIGPVLARRIPGVGRGSGRGWGTGREDAKTRDRSGASVLLLSVFSLVIAGYGIAFGYSAAQPAAPGGESVLARWLVARGLRYGLGGMSANVITVDSGGQVRVMPTVLRGDRVRPLLYQSPVTAYSPRLHDATFLVAATPADRVGYPQRAVRTAFGAPSGVYRFAGYTVDVWRVNLLTRMRS